MQTFFKFFYDFWNVHLGTLHILVQACLQHDHFLITFCHTISPKFSKMMSLSSQFLCPICHFYTKDIHCALKHSTLGSGTLHNPLWSSNTLTWNPTNVFGKSLQLFIVVPSTNKKTESTEHTKTQIRRPLINTQM